MNDQSLRAASTRSLPAEVHEGALLAGRYRIGRMLGSGGMGAVLAAEHVELNEPVAIKVLLRDAAVHTTPEAIGRFTREAWAASKIKSEYVARVTDSGRLEDGTPYIVMEYLEGIDLEGLLVEQGPLEIETLVELMLQACEALAEAHALGIFHRDLKPSNLFCIRRSDGLMAIKLLDFGISKIAPAANSFLEARLTGTASTLGTPLYMSPEQMRSGRVADERSDIWSLGVILYEMLLGRVPFMADNLADLAVRIATQLPTSISEERSDVPPELDRAILRCLEKETSQRYQSVAELARALAPFGPPRAAAHAERAERILLTQSTRSLPKINTTRGSALSMAGSHARLRATNAQTLSVKRPAPQTIAIAVTLAVLVVALALAVFRRSGHEAAARTTTPARRETRTSASSVPPSAAASSAIKRAELPPTAADVPQNGVRQPRVAPLHELDEPDKPDKLDALPPTAADTPQKAPEGTAGLPPAARDATAADAPQKAQESAKAREASAAPTAETTRKPPSASAQEPAAAPRQASSGAAPTQTRAANANVEQRVAPPPPAAISTEPAPQKKQPATDSELDSLGGRL